MLWKMGLCWEGGMDGGVFLRVIEKVLKDIVCEVEGFGLCCCNGIK